MSLRGWQIVGALGRGNFTRMPKVGENVVMTMKKINSKNTQSIIGAILS